MPKLRGHHLICLHFFQGQGYDEAFIKNLNNILDRVEEDRITISSGADDVCASCLYLKQGRCRQEENTDEVIPEMDFKALELLGVSPGDTVEWNTLRNRIPGKFSEWFSLYCRECDWKGACEKVGFFQRLKKKL
jgi:hypothetical protein